MRGMTRGLAVAAVVLGSMAYGGPASADPFGPATAGFTFTNNPGNPRINYTISSPNGSVVVGPDTRLTGVTGTFSGVTAGFSSGVVAFSSTVGTTLIESLPALFTFTDPLGGLYTFDADSVRTTALSQDLIEGTDNFQLYLLGNLGGGHLALTPTLTSVVFNLAGFLGQSSNYSLILANPPDPPDSGPAPTVPEPMSLAVFGVGLAGLAFVRRVRFGRVDRTRPAAV